MSSVRSDVLVRIVAVGILAVAASTVGYAQQLVIKARGYVTPDGSLQRGAVVVIDDGKIVSVNSEEAGQAETHEYADAVLCPGLIDIDASLSAVSQLAESANPILADATAQDALDPYAKQLRRALHAGVTTFLLAPDDSNLVGGQSALCSTVAGDSATMPGPLKISLAPSVYRASFEPSSRAGAMQMLRHAISQARSAAAESDNDTALKSFADGGIAAIVTAPFGADVFAAAQLAKETQVKLIVLHVRDAARVADVAGDFAGVVVGPYSISADQKSAAAAGIFAKAGVPVAIAGGTPFAAESSLRFGAAMAARNGLSLELARQAITSTPAKLLKVDDKIGSIEAGRAADLVIFSGDPLDLRSRVVAVYKNGALVYRAETTDDASLEK
ncbi:MAG: amidohydrolase family protein [Phycisphaerae bacterium]